MELHLQMSNTRDILVFSGHLRKCELRKFLELCHRHWQEQKEPNYWLRVAGGKLGSRQKERNVYGTPLKARHLASKGINLYNLDKEPDRWVLTLLPAGGELRLRESKQLANIVTQFIHWRDGTQKKSFHHQSTHFQKHSRADSLVSPEHDSSPSLAVEYKKS